MTHPDDEIEPHLKAQMNRMGRIIDTAINPNGGREQGFFLAMFPLGPREGRFNYISNADRRDIIVLLKEMTARFEGQAEVTGHG